MGQALLLTLVFAVSGAILVYVTRQLWTAEGSGGN
jgi:hypothetical protein